MILTSLGTENGKAFEPDERQTHRLQETIVVGESMTKAIDGNNHLDTAFYVTNGHWGNARAARADRRTKWHRQLGDT